MPKHLEAGGDVLHLDWTGISGQPCCGELDVHQIVSPGRQFPLQPLLAAMHRGIRATGKDRDRSPVRNRPPPPIRQHQRSASAPSSRKKPPLILATCNRLPPKGFRRSASEHRDHTYPTPEKAPDPVNPGCEKSTPFEAEPVRRSTPNWRSGVAVTP